VPNFSEILHIASLNCAVLLMKTMWNPLHFVIQFSLEQVDEKMIKFFFSFQKKILFEKFMATQHSQNKVHSCS
jgi:hypothetical protein